MGLAQLLRGETMTTKEPAPPARQLLRDHPDAELILSLAIRWRRAQLAKDAIEESTYALSLGVALDEMVHDLEEKAAS